MKKSMLVAEWLMVGLMVATVMISGWTRQHHLNINRFLLLSYGVILGLLILYRALLRRQGGAEETAVGRSCAHSENEAE